MNTRTMIPPGFHFSPTDEELITHYLLRRAMGQPLPCDHALEKNLYGDNANPWNVLDIISDEEDSHWDTTHASGSKNVNKVVYVFTRLMKVNNNGKSRNIARTAGCGKWDGQTAGRKIYNDSGEEIGMMKMFNFQAKKGVDHDRWIMHEFSLSGVSLKLDLKYEDYVICKITRILSKEKFDREEKEKRLFFENVKNIDDALSGKKRLLEVLQEDSSDYKKQKSMGSTAVVDPEADFSLEDDCLLSLEEIWGLIDGVDHHNSEELSGPKDGNMSKGF